MAPRKSLRPRLHHLELERLEARRLMAIDLSVEHDTFEPAEPGEEVTRVIRVYNHGDEVAEDVLIQSSLTDELENPTWQRTLTDGRVRPAPSAMRATDYHLLAGSITDVRAAGDINGDGAEDLLVSQSVSRRSEAGKREQVHQVTVIFAGDQLELLQDQLEFTGDFGFTVDVTSNLPPRLERLGDVNGDGFDDLAIGNQIVFGGREPPDFENTNSTRIFNIGSQQYGVYGIGDVNADGIDDLLIWPHADDKATVFLGRRELTAADLLAENADLVVRLPEDAAVPAPLQDYRHWISVAAPVGDINGDGWNDFAFGSAWHVSVVLGGPQLGTHDEVFDPTNAFQIELEFGFRPDFYRFPGYITSAGDINADGFDDMLLSFDGGAWTITASQQASVDRIGGAVILFGGSSFEPGGQFDHETNDHVVYRLAAPYGGTRPSARIGDLNADEIPDLQIRTGHLSYVMHGGWELSDMDLGYAGRTITFEHQWNDSFNGQDGYGIRGEITFFDINADGRIDQLVETADGGLQVFLGVPSDPATSVGHGNINDVSTIQPGQSVVYQVEGTFKENGSPTLSTVWFPGSLNESTLANNVANSTNPISGVELSVATDVGNRTNQEMELQVRFRNDSTNNASQVDIEIDHLLNDATWESQTRLFPSTIDLDEIDRGFGVTFAGPERAYLEGSVAPGYRHRVIRELGEEIGFADLNNDGQVDIWGFGSDVWSDRREGFYFDGGSEFGADGDFPEPQYVTAVSVSHPQGLDINADGFEDTIVPKTNVFDNNGAIHLLYGTSDGAPSPATIPNGVNGFSIGIDGRENSSASYSFATGDVNGDGIDDLLFGDQAPTNEISASPFVHVVFGNAGGITTGRDGVLRTSSISGDMGFKIELDQRAAQYSGMNLTSGDINGDGIDDIIVSESYDLEWSHSAPKAYVIFGRSKLEADQISKTSELNGWNGFTLTAPDRRSISSRTRTLELASRFDVNNDGIEDLLIGDSHAGEEVNWSYHGALHVLFGQHENHVNGVGDIATSTDIPPMGEIRFTVFGSPPSHENDSLITASVSPSDEQVDLDPRNNRIEVATRSLVSSSDINSSGEVDFADFLILANNFGRTDAAFADGDLDGNGEVNFLDFLVLAEHFEEHR